MSAKFERKAYVVSPHQDDAVLSIGMILREYGRVDIANLFTLSDSHILPNVDMSKEAVSLMRHEEDKSVAEALYHAADLFKRLTHAAASVFDFDGIFFYQAVDILDAGGCLVGQF